MELIILKGLLGPGRALSTISLKYPQVKLVVQN